MKALAVTITRNPWPAGMARHWHLVDSYISRHVITAVERVYGEHAIIEEFSWANATEPPTCSCGERLV